MGSKKEYILCAAIWYKDFDTTQGTPKNIDKGLVICGRRHPDCIFIYWKLTGKSTGPSNSIQGFMTNLDRFVLRIEAVTIAQNSGQINWNKEKQKLNKSLYSEDLY